MFNSNINKVDLIYEIKPNIVYTNIIFTFDKHQTLKTQNYENKN
jgi:hypothetical protein